MYKKLSGFGLSDIQIKSVMKLYEERDKFRKAEEGLIESIKEYGAKNANVVRKLLSNEELKFENGKIIGFEKQLEEMKKNSETSFLFEEEMSKGEDMQENIFTGIIPSESESEVLEENLSYEDLCEIL